MRQPKRLPDLHLLELNFGYCPVTGVLTNLSTGNALGTNDRTTGAMKCRVGGTTTQVARVAWALYYKEDPVDKRIVHINGNNRDNRIENLRAVRIK